jgi:hypothetical protein
MNNEHPPILLLSPPACGKTYSLKDISPELAKRTLHINCDDKPLPWVGKSTFTAYQAQCPTLIPDIIKQGDDSGQFDLIVVDTLTIAMGEYARKFINTATPKYAMNGADCVTNMNYVSVTKQGAVDGMGAWGRYGTLVSDIVAAANASNAQVVIMGHLSCTEDEGGDLTWKCPLQGAVGRAGIEGLFSIVMHAKKMKLDKLVGEYEQDHKYLGTEESEDFTNSRYVFQVAHTKDTVHSHALRTIAGLWPKGVRFIDNDLQMVFDRFAEVWAP